MKEEEVVELFSRIFGTQYSVYNKSLKEKEEKLFFLVRDDQEKYLCIYGDFNKFKKLDFHIKAEKKLENSQNNLFQICPLKSSNMAGLQRIFPYLKPLVIGKKSSFGTGDRLGSATPAHVKAFKGKDVLPVLAQQLEREMERTESNWQKVMENAIWGCFEEGYERPFGADADHVKDLENLQKAIDCGYTLFTINPSDFIVKNISQHSTQEIFQRYIIHYYKNIFSYNPLFPRRGLG